MITNKNIINSYLNYAFLVMIYIGINIVSTPDCISQNKQTSDVKVSINTVQEKNLLTFVEWLERSANLQIQSKLAKELISLLKNNDYSNYIVKIKSLKEEINLLEVKKKQDIIAFMGKLDNNYGDNSINSPIPEGSCIVSCPFGTCAVNCGTGGKPSCTCSWGFPVCECK